MRILDLLMLVRLLLVDCQRLALKSVALRHQITILKRSVARPKVQDSDGMFWILMMRMLKEWKDVLYFVCYRISIQVYSDCDDRLGERTEFSGGTGAA
jgi:membrane protein CcdC involved in cytochrome C biogenesis